MTEFFIKITFLCQGEFNAFVGYYLPPLIRHRGYDLERVISHLFSEQGIFNIPIGISVRYVFLFILPIFALIFFLVGLKTTATLAGFWATVVTFVIAFVKRVTRMGWKKILDTLADGAIKATQVAAVCACAGIIIGIVALTGVGLKISAMMIDLGGVSILLSLFIAMCISLILGMGLPTTAAYIICAAIVAPSLIKLGLTPLGAHLFIFYFSCLSAITPPVAVAAYVAPNRTSSRLSPSSHQTRTDHGYDRFQFTCHHLRPLGLGEKERESLISEMGYRIYGEGRRKLRDG